MPEPPAVTTGGGFCRCLGADYRRIESLINAIDPARDGIFGLPDGVFMGLTVDAGSGIEMGENRVEMGFLYW
jgi:hypothetical protein